EARRQLRITGRLRQRAFVAADGEVEVALAVSDLAEQQRGRQEPRLELDGALEKPQRVGVAAEHMGRRPRTDVERRIARVQRQRFAERRRRLVAVVVSERFPAGFGQLGARRLRGERCGGEYQEGEQPGAAFHLVEPLEKESNTFSAHRNEKVYDPFFLFPGQQ